MVVSLFSLFAGVQVLTLRLSSSIRMTRLKTATSKRLTQLTVMMSAQTAQTGGISRGEPQLLFVVSRWDVATRLV